MDDRERRLRDESTSNYHGWYKFVCLYGYKYVCRDCSRQSTDTRHIRVGLGIRDDKERWLLGMKVHQAVRLIISNANHND